MTAANDNAAAPKPQPSSREADGLLLPTPRLVAAVQEVQERRFKRRPAQVFDTSALPLFGDQRHQLELF